MSLSLVSCAALNFVHDPQSGLITRSQVPKLLQSVRCELVTYYQADLWRKAQFIATSDGDYTAAVRDHSFFPLDPRQLGVVFLDLKVTDSLGIPSSPTTTTINQTVLSNGGVDKRTWHFGPTASDTNTYELNWPLAIPQSSTLAIEYEKKHSTKTLGSEFFPCYHNLPKTYSIPSPGDPALTRPDNPVEHLARHEYPGENFARIYVDGVKPLAEWLLDSSKELGTALFQEPTVDPNNTERMYPAQMIYTFTVQVSVGADASESLITAHWNPIGLDISASTQQASMLTIYINGDDAMNANGAKVGLIAVPQTPIQGPAAAPKAPPTACPSPFNTCGTPKYPIAIPIPGQ